MAKNHQEIRLHGHLDETIEYFAMAASPDAYSRYFFESSNESLRFFSPGNEFILETEQISHRGNGGSFCEYMFGVDQPLSDLAKTDVRNRLVLYGTFYKGQDGGNLDFTSKTDDEIKTLLPLFFSFTGMSGDQGSAECDSGYFIPDFFNYDFCVFCEE